MIVKNTSRPTVRRYDKTKYAKLLADAQPAPIRSEREYDQAIAQIEALLKKGKGITAEEDRLLDLLSTLVEIYEDEHYDFEPAAPHEVLQHLMEARDLKQKDLVHLFGSSGRASEAINGKRPISLEQAKSLAGFFKVSADLFLQI